MTEHKKSDWGWTAFAISTAAFSAAGFAAIVFFITAANMQHSEEKTERVTTCIEAGGSWLEYTEDCLQLVKE
jgi:hypothetical protein